MKIETLAIVFLVVAAIVFLLGRRREISQLKQQNEELRKRSERLEGVAIRQREEIDKLIHTTEQERRARQMATLTNQETPARPTRDTISRRQD